MQKKGDMSLQIIVIAALALIVLIVLAVIFSGKLGIFGKQTTSTTEQYSGQKCAVPGTTRACMDSGECNTKGGINMGQLDCSYGICCAT